MIYQGLLNRHDAQAFRHYWTVRGHSVRLEKTRHLFRVYLKLTLKEERD